MKAVSIVLIFITLLTMGSISTVAQKDSPVGEAERAEALVHVAEKAYTRIESLVKELTANETLMGNVKAMGLSGAFNANLSLCSQAKDLIELAKAKLQAGNHTDAVNLALQAMGILHKAFKAFNLIFEQAGVKRVEPTKAQGLLVAANRTLERIESMKGTMDADSVKDLLAQAKALLENVEELVREDKVDEAARSLANANRLTAQAFSTLRSKAEERMPWRAERFIEGFGQIHGEIANKISKAGLNASEFLSGLGLKDFDRLKQDLIGRVKGAKPEDLKRMMNELKDIGGFLHAIRSQITSLPLVKVRVKDILNNPTAWIHKTVVIVGKYCQTPPEGLPGPTGSPPKDWPSWIIMDETGWIHVVMKGRMLTPFLKPAYEEKVTVVGVVEGGVEAPYIVAKAVLSPPIKPMVSQPVKGILNVSVEKSEAADGYVLKVTVINKGNDTVIFPNGVLGITVWRMVNGVWRPFYTPISIQVLTELKPGESKTVTLRLKHPPKGVYKVTASSWLKAGQPVMAEAVFTIP
ncbi:MAG: hypothetical protein QXQ28_07110 [Candidatus Nezhaarchaeales archaeon]